MPTYAQYKEYKKKTPEEKAKKYTAEMVTDLGLNKEQEDKVFMINVDVSKLFDSVYALKIEDEKLRKKSFANIYKYRDSMLRVNLPTPLFLQFQDMQREKRAKKLTEKKTDTLTTK
jgi:hypothetical protein